jgi:hypothetical protein
MLLLVGLVGFAIVRFTQRESHRRGAKGELMKQIQTWEDEGGNVPNVPTVSPRADSSRFELSRRRS